MAKKENFGIRIIIGVAVLGILLAAVPIFFSITEEPANPAFIFREYESVPDDALVHRLPTLNITENSINRSL